MNSPSRFVDGAKPMKMQTRCNGFVFSILIWVAVLFGLPAVPGARADVFRTTGSMTTARWLNTATVLPNGKILVAGGADSSFNPFASAELFDPATGAWTATGSMQTPRYYHSATLLPNGKVLCACGPNQGFSPPASFFEFDGTNWHQNKTA